MPSFKKRLCDEVEDSAARRNDTAEIVIIENFSVERLGKRVVFGIAAGHRHKLDIIDKRHHLIFGVGCSLFIKAIRIPAIEGVYDIGYFSSDVIGVNGVIIK